MMRLVQPNIVTIHLGLIYEGQFENGMRHGRGTLSLRSFTPLPETGSFLPEWRARERNITSMLLADHARLRSFLVRPAIGLFCLVTLYFGYVVKCHRTVFGPLFYYNGSLKEAIRHAFDR